MSVCHLVPRNSARRRLTGPRHVAALLLAIAVTAACQQAAEQAEQGSAADAPSSSTASTSTAGPPTPDAPVAPPSSAAPDPTYPGALEEDEVAAGPGAQVRLSGWTASASALKRTTSPLGTDLCSTVTLTNRDDVQQDYNASSWKLQAPGGNVQDVSFSGADHLQFGGLAPAGKISRKVCFQDQQAGRGQYVLSWQPDLFSSQARGVWLLTL